MNCKKVMAILPELVSGELDSKTYSEAMDHINKCPQCRSEMLKYKDALGNLSHAWTPVQTPEALDFLSLPKKERNRFIYWRFGFAGVCAAVIVALIIAIPCVRSRSSRETLPTRRDTVMVAPYEEHQPKKVKLPEMQPKKQPQPKLEQNNGNKPEPEIKNREHKWDERRLRPRRQWDYYAYNNRKPKQTPIKSIKTLPKKQNQDNPEPVTVAANHSTQPDTKPLIKVEMKPTVQKVMQPMVNYDRYGNKQITLTQTEEQSSQPCVMALY